MILLTSPSSTNYYSHLIVGYYIVRFIQKNDTIDIKPSMIQPVGEIKSLGKHKVKISLHSAVDAEITIDVKSAETIQ